MIIEDSLGICDELEEQMQHLVNTYQCEWKAAIENTEKLKLFRNFINTDAMDSNLVYVEERNQKRPATEQERKVLSSIAQ